jgi:hypothetical protein
MQPSAADPREWASVRHRPATGPWRCGTARWSVQPRPLQVLMPGAHGDGREDEGNERVGPGQARKRFAARPSRMAATAGAQQVLRPSPVVAAEPSWLPSRRLAWPNTGMRRSRSAPARSRSSCVGLFTGEEATCGFDADVGGEQEERHRHDVLGALLGVRGVDPEPFRRVRHGRVVRRRSRRKWRRPGRGAATGRRSCRGYGVASRANATGAVNAERPLPASAIRLPAYRSAPPGPLIGHHPSPRALGARWLRMTVSMPNVRQ